MSGVTDVLHSPNSRSEVFMKRPQRIYQVDITHKRDKRAHIIRRNDNTIATIYERNDAKRNTRRHVSRKLLVKRPVSLDTHLDAYAVTCNETSPDGNEVHATENADRNVGACVQQKRDNTSSENNKSAHNRNSPRLLNTSRTDQRAVSERIVRESEYSIKLPVINTTPHTINSLHEYHSTHSFLGGLRKNLPPVAAQAFKSMQVQKDNECELVYDSNDTCSANEDAIEDIDFDERVENIVISPFPLTGDEEISKHKQMNDDLTAHTRRVSSVNSDYLRRLKLMRTQLSPSKLNERKRAVKELSPKSPLHRIPSRKKWIRPVEIEPLPKPVLKRRDIHDKPSKVIQSFKYSYAVENYYNSERENCSSPEDENDDFQVTNGWLVHNLGRRVLNVNARSMPSCNPFSQRNRIRELRIRAMEEGTTIPRNTSRESISSRASDSASRTPRVRFQDVLAKLQPAIHERVSEESKKTLQTLVDGFVPKCSREMLRCDQNSKEIDTKSSAPIEGGAALPKLRVTVHFSDGLRSMSPDKRTRPNIIVNRYTPDISVED